MLWLLSLGVAPRCSAPKADGILLSIKSSVVFVVSRMLVDKE